MCWYEGIAKDATMLLLPVICFLAGQKLISSLPPFLHVEAITPATKQEQDPRQGRQAGPLHLPS